MNKVKFSFTIFFYVGIVFSTFLTSCYRDNMKPNPLDLEDNTRVAAEFQINWFVPTTSIEISNSYADSLYVDEMLYYDEKYHFNAGNVGTPFTAYNGFPTSSKRFDIFFFLFANKYLESNNILQFYKSDKIVYETQLTNLKKGRYNFVVYDLKKSPLVIDNKYPYFSTEEKKKSHCSIMFVNVLFSDMTTTYPGKCQYQYSINGEEVWHNLGTPVKFGETTDRVELELNDNSVLFSFRVLDEDGNELNRKDSEKITKKATIKPGESYMYFLGGTLTDNSDIYPWRSL